MAENHPVAFRWVMQAKLEHGAKLIHVDPRFTRTSGRGRHHAPIRAGSDIAFLGGLINYVIKSERWNTDPFFQEYVVNYTNAATHHQRGVPGHRGPGRRLLRADGVQARRPGWPSTASSASTTTETWQYARHRGRRQGRAAATAQSGEQGVGRASRATQQDAGPAPGPPLRRRWSQSLLKPPPPTRPDAAGPALRLPDREAALRPLHPGDGRAGHRLPAGALPEVAETLLDNSGAGPDHGHRLRGRLDPAHLRRADDRRGGAAAAAARQHRPARRRHHGAARPRHDPGHRTDIPTLYHSIHGYMPHPTRAQEPRDAVATT